MKIPIPDKFLAVIHPGDGNYGAGLCACAGFELGKWRSKKLAAHMLNWLPHFALRPREYFDIGPANPYTLIKRAASRIFKAEDGFRRGELGELLLHIVSVTEYDAVPFVTRLFYKMRSNDQVTGFDSTLVVVKPDSDDVELWLGEAKFYKDVGDAVSEAIKSINAHLDEGFLEETKILVGPKIEPGTLAYEKLQWLFDDGVPLDQMLKCIVIPVLIAAQSEAAVAYDGSTANYLALAVEEYEYIRTRLAKAGFPVAIKIVAIYVPLGSKEEIENEFIKKIGEIE